MGKIALVRRRTGTPVQAILPTLIWGPPVKRRRELGRVGTDKRRRTHPCGVRRAGQSEALIAWMALFFERSEGVKGGFAAA